MTRTSSVVLVDPMNPRSRATALSDHAALVVGVELAACSSWRMRGGHSCILLGSGDGQPFIHVVCAPKDDYLAVVTAYIPRPDQWSADFRRRK